MLRTLLLIFSIALTALAAVLLLAGVPAGVPMAFWGVLLCVAVLIERWRYRPRHVQTEGDWVKTDERFIDPETGQAMQVFYNPRTGDRRYGSADEKGST